MVTLNKSERTSYSVNAHNVVIDFESSLFLWTKNSRSLQKNISCALFVSTTSHLGLFWEIGRVFEAEIILNLLRTRNEGTDPSFVLNRVEPNALITFFS